MIGPELVVVNQINKLRLTVGFYESTTLYPEHSEG